MKLKYILTTRVVHYLWSIQLSEYIYDGPIVKMHYCSQNLVELMYSVPVVDFHAKSLEM